LLQSTALVLRLSGKFFAFEPEQAFAVFGGTKHSPPEEVLSRNRIRAEIRGYLQFFATASASPESPVQMDAPALLAAPRRV
jgi:hypothetical protein